MKHPERVGKYEISRVLGQGGMGTVYEARDSVINRKVALKMMLHGLAENPDLRERFMREAQAAGGLRHRNIVTVYDFDVDEEGRPYIAMEFIEGTDLERVIQTREPHPIAWKLDVIRQLCAGLAFAHRAGIVHRDVKPANIRVSPDGEVKIMDFGIVRLQSSNLTKSGLVLGSAHYMAPEQINGLRADHRSDLFSVGAIGFELLSGRKPFEADSLTAVLFKVTHERPDADALPKSAYSPGLEQVILKALATSPDERYQTLDAMDEDLERVEREALSRPQRSAPATDPFEAMRKRVEHKMAEGRKEIAEARAEGQLQKALALCQKLLEMQPDDADVQRDAEEIKAMIQDREVEQLVTMADSYLAEGDRALAERIAARAARMAPESPRYLALRARLDALADVSTAATLLEAAGEHLVHGNLQEARAAAEEALSVEPRNAAAREILERVSKVLAVRDRAAPAMVIESDLPAPEPPPPAPSMAGPEEVFFDEAAPASPPTPIPVAVAPDPEGDLPAVLQPPMPPAPMPPPPAPKPPAFVAPPSAPPQVASPAPPAPPAPVVAAAPAVSKSEAPAAPAPPRVSAPPTPRGPIAAPVVPAPPPVAATPAAAPTPVVAVAAPPADRKAEAAALATQAMNHFVASANAKARKAAERALELDPTNKKARDLLKILALG